MNLYQEFIREIEANYKTSTDPYLCNLANKVYDKHPVKYKECLKRFNEEISVYSTEAYTISRYLKYIIKAFTYYPTSEDIYEFRLLILHRLYQDANFDFWIGE